MSKAANTRKYILEHAFDLVYHHGYQATSIDKIIETTSVTKGAFFYHFKNKQQMGLALIREVIFPRIKEGLIFPLSSFEDPIEGIYTTISNFMLGTSEKQLMNGCPTNNLVQEMAPLDEEFREALIEIMSLWEKTIASLLVKAEEQGRLWSGHDFDAIARYIVASYEGARATGKLYRSHDYYRQYLSQLRSYLESL